MPAQPDTYKIIVVGGGPAGLAAALHLTQRIPSLVPELLILEAAHHPRPKLCGGGVTFHGEEQLRHLGLTLDVPSVTIHNLAFQLQNRVFTIRCPNAMRVIMREEFDAALAQATQARGLQLHLGERVLDIAPAAGGMHVVTSKKRYFSEIVIGADGANSIVRQKLKLPATLGVARLLRMITPVEIARSRGWQEQTAVFDFSCIAAGIQGYVWDFPCQIDGAAFMNRGIFDSRISPEPAAQRTHGALKQTFLDGLRRRDVDLEAVPLEGHPVRWFNPDAEFSRPHVLLTGDAAGVDPLFAEGISYAMEYGEIVTDTILNAWETSDFSFSDYRQRLLNHQLGKLLRRRAFIARHLYRFRYPRLWSLFWRLAAMSPRVVQRQFGASLGLLPP